MKQKVWKALDQKFKKYPRDRAKEAPRAAEIADAEAALGCKFHKDYVEFLRRYGAAFVGSQEIYGLRPAESMGNSWSVIENTELRRNEEWPGASDWYIISDDGWGNPIGIAPDGRVLMTDHDSGFQLVVVAQSFEQFLEQLLEEDLEDDVEPHDDADPLANRKWPDLEDCEAVSQIHEWFNVDGVRSACINCCVVRQGQLWRNKRKKPPRAAPPAPKNTGGLSKLELARRQGPAGR